VEKLLKRPENEGHLCPFFSQKAVFIFVLPSAGKVAAEMFFQGRKYQPVECIK